MTPDRAAVEVVRAVVARRPHIVAAYLFGSAARGARNAQDLDIAVMFTHGADGFREALELQVKLELETDFPVDVHNFEALPVDLQYRVLQEGEVLFEADHRERLRRHVKAQNEYFDFKPYLDRIRAGAVRRLRAKVHG